MQKPELERSQRKALGKGLSALLPGKNGPLSRAPGVEPAVPPSPPHSPFPENFEEFESIGIEQFVVGEDQPRTSFDAEKMAELAQSIRAHGVIQPITVVRAGDRRYRIVAGERRWRAAQAAGLKAIPALVRTIPDDQMLELALIENIQREDLNPIETANAFSRLIHEHKLSHEQVAERTGKERSTVTNFLRLLKLTREIQEQLIQGVITMGHARALLALPDEQAQRKAAHEIAAKKLSVRETERLVKVMTEPAGEPTPKRSRDPGPLDANERAAVEELQSALGTRVRIVPKTRTSGKLEIEYYSQDDLDRIYAVIVR